MNYFLSGSERTGLKMNKTQLNMPRISNENLNISLIAIYTRRVSRQYGICWPKKELSMVHGTIHIFLGIKLFLFLIARLVQDRKVNLSASV